jgi:myo-inositol-1(or 4)-monophosphatase
MSSTTLSPDDLRGLLVFCTDLAKKAGELIIEGSRVIQSAPPEVINEKKNAVDLVTEYDVRVEELVRQEIGKHYPSYSLWVITTKPRVLPIRAAVSAKSPMQLEVVMR